MTQDVLARFVLVGDRLDLDRDDFEEDEEFEATVRAMLLAQRRQSVVLSLSEMESHSGLPRGTVIAALQVLTTPLFDNRTIPLMAKGPALPRTPTWYAPDRRAWGWHWTSDFLNTPERVKAEQQQLWPSLTRRWRSAQRRRILRRR
jgi:hypothetical protein